MKIKLTEKQLNNIITESIKHVLKEDNFGSNGNNPIYQTGPTRYDKEIANARANQNMRDRYATEKNIQDRYEQNRMAVNSENFLYDMEKVNKIKLKVIQCYQMFKNYESRGMLGKFFASKPQIAGEVFTLRNIYVNDPEAVTRVNPKLVEMLNYFVKLGVIRPLK